jgi:Arc/MetJ-type ribon-helix-helix transcriptional regulator
MIIMPEKTITLTIPEPLYNQAQKLVDTGLFKEFSEIVNAGIQTILLECELFEDDSTLSNLSAGEHWAYYVQKIRQEIKQIGGLFSGKTNEEVIELLRKTRDEVFEEKYASHFRYE